VQRDKKLMSYEITDKAGKPYVKVQINNEDKVREGHRQTESGSGKRGHTHTPHMQLTYLDTQPPNTPHSPWPTLTCAPLTHLRTPNTPCLGDPLAYTGDPPHPQSCGLADNSYSRATLLHTQYPFALT